MKKFLFMIGIVIIFIFTGCGSSKSSDEGKALLKHSLQLLGIPPEIVVNICQDDNNNGSCDVGELQANINVNQNDSIAQMWEKVKFDTGGRYILENYDPTKNIIMEIDGKKSAEYNNVDLSLKYKADTEELSVLQAVVDADFLNEEDVTKFKALENRENIDRAIFNGLTKNQTLLEEQNLSTKTALSINLEEIAKGLIQLDVSKELPEQLEQCGNSDSCIEELINNTTKEIELTEDEARELARSKNIADGYIIKLVEPVEAVCKDGKRYSSSLEIKEKGKITFDSISNDCTITVKSGAIIDSNNNGKLDRSDKVLEFDMIGSENNTFITPLTTLLFKKREKGEDTATFSNMIYNFDPVTAPSRVTKNSGLEKIKIEKLIVLLEIVKRAMKDSLDISLLNLSTLLDESRNLNFDTLLKQLPKKSANKLKAKAMVMQNILSIFKDIDTSLISVNTFIVSLTDGEKNIENALIDSLILPRPVDVNVVDFIIQNSESRVLIKGLIEQENINLNTPPVANAGVDQTVIQGESVTLDGSKSSGSIKQYEWYDEGGSQKKLSDKAVFSMNDLAVGSYTFILIVTDDKGATVRDSVVITVNKAPAPVTGFSNIGTISDALISPNGGEVWVYDTSKTITWAEPELYGNIDLYLLQDDPSNLAEVSSTLTELLNSKNWYQFESNISNTGSYTLNPRDLNGNGDAYVILIVDDNENWDISDNTFSLVDNTPSNFKLKKTGQTLSYDEAGTIVTDNSQKDDGFYQKGLAPNYSRDAGNETVTDHVTGLMWQDDSAVSSVTKQWLTQANFDVRDYSNTVGDTATTYCNELVLGGYSDWRLPTRTELQGIVDYGYAHPAINPIFVNTSSSIAIFPYWSSTTNALNNDYAWSVHFSRHGIQEYTSKAYSSYVRCVRVGQ